MDSFVILAEQLTLFQRGTDGRISEVLSCSPRNPLVLRDLQLAPDGRQVLAISSNPDQGVCFACLTKGRNEWLYFDFMPTAFVITCGVHSPTTNYIVYLGTSTGDLVQFNLKTKVPSVLSKGDRRAPVTSIDVNCVGTQLAASVGGSVLLHSIRNKVDTYLDYDSRTNAKVFIRFHPTRQFTLGIFSLAEGAAFVDLTSAQPVVPSRDSRLRPPPGEGHICNPCAILWGTTETLFTVANDGRIVLYAKKSCGQVYRHSENIHSACILKDGSEILLGLENGLACFDIKRRQVSWSKTLGTIKAVERLARAKTHLPIANQKSGIESLYPQKVALNPDVRHGLLGVSIKSSDGELISPLKGSLDDAANFQMTGLMSMDLRDDKRRKSSLGSMISPPKSHNVSLSQLSTISLPTRRTFTPATITEEGFSDPCWKENEDTVLQSTHLHGDDASLGKVDFGLDSASPVRPARSNSRQPLSHRQAEHSTMILDEPKEKAVFCNVDSSRSTSKLSQESQAGMNSLLERQNTLLSQLAESSARIEAKLAENSARIESKLDELLHEVREQGLSDRRLVSHGIQLLKTYHGETLNVLTAMLQVQDLEWLDPFEAHNGNDKSFGGSGDM